MHQTKKEKLWHVGIKVHVRAGVDSGAVHTVEITAANEADINVLPKLLRAEGKVVFGNAGYASDEYKRGSRRLGILWCGKINTSSGKVSRRARRSETGNVSQFGYKWNMCSG